MNITLISPNIVTQKGDFFGSGIPYMPFTMAYLASYLRSKKQNVTVIDSFGLNPFKVRRKDDFFYQGITPAEVLARIPKDTQLFCLSADRVVAHGSLAELITAIRKQFSTIPIAIVENSQAVTAYSLKKVAQAFFDLGVDYVVVGEPEHRFEKLIQCIQKKKGFDAIDGLIYRKNGKVEVIPVKEMIHDLDSLPFPAWDLIPLKNYWKLKYAHAPLSNKRYLPLLTSRGCPYGCRFCVVPATNYRKWRYRTARNVVDEMEYFVKQYGIQEFHLEDLNPTILKQRMVEMSKEILRRKLSVKWKIGSGTKVESVDKDTLFWMAKAGCTYISISPESGSKKVLALIDKPFNHQHGLDMITYLHKLKVYTQTCFVLGYPGEKKEDLLLTKKYVLALAKAGVDEVALFIITPVPGSYIYESFEKEMPKNMHQLTFSPKWRKEYAMLHRFRTKLYLQFAIHKLLYHPLKLFKQALHFCTRRFYTKMDMTIYRVLKLRWMTLWSK